MPHNVLLGKRDLALLGLVRSFPAAISRGGLMHYYRITTDGFRLLEPESTSGPSRTSLVAIAPSRLKHAMVTADIIVHALVAAHTAHVRIAKFHGDNQLTLTVGEFRAEPDCHFQFEYGDRVFNVLVEVDNATEPLDSPREQSIRSKLLGYEAYQDRVLRGWRQGGAHAGCRAKSERPGPRRRPPSNLPRLRRCLTALFDPAASETSRLLFSEHTGILLTSKLTRVFP